MCTCAPFSERQSPLIIWEEGRAQVWRKDSSNTNLEAGASWEQQRSLGEEMKACLQQMEREWREPCTHVLAVQMASPAPAVTLGQASVSVGSSLTRPFVEGTLHCLALQVDQDSGDGSEGT